MFIFPVQLTITRIGNLTRLIHTLLYVMTMHIIPVRAVAKGNVYVVSVILFVYVVFYKHVSIRGPQLSCLMVPCNTHTE